MRLYMVYYALHARTQTDVQWLTERFLPYLDDWKSVDGREGVTKAEKGMMLLSSETRLGLRITGEHSHACNSLGLYIIHVYT